MAAIIRHPTTELTTQSETNHTHHSQPTLRLPAATAPAGTGPATISYNRKPPGRRTTQLHDARTPNESQKNPRTHASLVSSASATDRSPTNKVLWLERADGAV